jgi:hypothetical protein
MLGSLRSIVGVRQSLCAVGEQVAELQLAEPGQRQVEAAELQFAEFVHFERSMPDIGYIARE